MHYKKIFLFSWKMLALIKKVFVIMEKQSFSFLCEHNLFLTLLPPILMVIGSK